MILVLGAGGIIGQHLRMTQPPNVSVVYTSQQQSLPRDFSLKVATPADIEILLERWNPDVVINLMGENRPDVVERDPGSHDFINVLAPFHLAQWCRACNKRLIHVSTQGVLSGLNPPYAAATVDVAPPVNAYGRQKHMAELYVLAEGGVVARLTFVLGIRPFPHVGRPNPVEQMIASRSSRQVYDRMFSVAFARDAACALWELAQEPPGRQGVVHVGTPGAVTRFELAQRVAEVFDTKAVITAVQHDRAFPPPWAQRPLDTTYADGSLHRQSLTAGLDQLVQDWRHRLDYFDVQDRATEIATFLGQPVDGAVARLGEGFGANHMRVAQDFRAANPQSDDRLLEWYRQTPAYIWELTAYHLDRGFNYRGMCQGILEHLRTHQKSRVLCLGDGIGDLTIQLREGGLSPTYHDLLGSLTAEFAAFRVARRELKDPPVTFLLTGTWDPPSVADWPPEEQVPFDAVIALDFFEHLVNVEAWAQRVYELLAPGGLFLAQNAFGIGDLEHEGSIPMHLTINNKYVTEWEPLLRRIGFVPADGGWWTK